MHVLVLGAGAIGSLLGARISRSGVRVTLLTTDRLHVQSICEKGLLVEELGGSLTHYSLPAFFDPGAIPEKVDLVLVAVKTYDTQVALEAIKGCSHSGTVYLTIQNGIGNYERISQLVGGQSVIVGVTAQGATLVEPGRIRHGGNGPTFIGEYDGPPTPRVERVVEMLRRSGLKADPGGAMQRSIWEKLLVNVGINAITAIAGIPNGVIAQHDAARELSRITVREAMLVAAARGFPVSDDMPERVLAVALATAINRSSMGQDVDRKTQTEIDAINGAIVDYADQLDIPVPVNRALTLLIRTIEANYR